MAPTLYVVPPSPPVRAVLMCAKALGIELNEKLLDVINGEHHKEDYRKINPVSTVPTLLEEDGFCLWNSHAIMVYLSDKYGKNDKLYPKDLKKRAKVNEKLFFEDGVVFACGVAISRPIVLDGKNTINEVDKKSLNGVYEKVERLLQSSNYISGDGITIADFSYITSLMTWAVLVPIDESKYPKIIAYINRMETLPYFKECNQKGQEMFVSLVKSKLN